MALLVDLRRMSPTDAEWKPLSIVMMLQNRLLFESVLEALEDISLMPSTLGRTYASILSATAENVDYADVYHAAFDAMFSRMNLYFEDDSEREVAIALAQAILTSTESEDLLTTWRRIREDSLFSCEVIEGIASRGILPDKLARLPEAEIADFFLWYYDQYPPHEDPKPGPDDALMRPVTVRDDLGSFRSRIIGILQEKGTQEAVSEMERIVRTLPEDRWLARMLQQTRFEMRFRAWNPPNPIELLELSQRAGARLVSNADQLLDVLMESLERLQQDLGDEGVPAQFLWDTRSREPKEEEALSDFIAYHFKRDLSRFGPIVAREVQIRRRLMDSQEGERTDIQVSVQVPSVAAAGLTWISVIIEVKGDWNPEVETAMQVQLVDRYLEKNSCQHGLFVVVWMKLKKVTSSGRGRPPKYTLATLRSTLTTQAKTLSNPTRRIEAFVLDASV
ncbi:MAG: hypothetical protein QM758_05465 [Armatimonas sp.]